MELAEDSLGAAIRPPEPPDAPQWRIPGGLRGALSPGVLREAAALVALAGPVVSRTRSCGRRAPGGRRKAEGDRLSAPCSSWRS